MPSNRPLTMLVLASYFKGERFIQQAKARGAKIYLLTVQKLLGKAWPRESLDDVFAQNDGPTLQQTLNTVCYLNRSIRFDRIVALDDFDVEVAANLREHLRLPGMGDSQARFFRDKLACRMKLRELGLAVPDFTPVFNNEVVAEWIAKVPAPWMLKPRSEASATGIHKVRNADELWSLLESKGDGRSGYLLEQFVPGDIYHVDALTTDGKVVFAEVGRCGDTPFEVAHGGGIFNSVTVARGSEDEKILEAFNEKILTSLGYRHGASHLEFIKGKADGKFCLLETSARVGGAHIAEMHEFASGVNLWQEWANVEFDSGARPYQLPQTRTDYAGLLITLAKQERPDFSAYADKEIVYRAPEPSHAGLIVCSPDREKVASLVDSYKQRFVNDFMTVLPIASKPSN